MPNLLEYKKMPQYDLKLWDFEYRVARYLEGCTPQYLQQRIEFLKKNISMIAGGIMDNIPMKVSFQSSWWWLKMLEHTKREMELRSIDYNDEDIATIDYPCKKNIIFSRGIHGNAIVRYSSSELICKSLFEGKFRLSISSTYSKDDTQARKDDEENKRYYTCGSQTTVTHVRSGTKISPIGNLTTTIRIYQYYLICFTRDLDIRVAHEFCPKDCGILTIFNEEEFNRRIKESIQKKYGPVIGESLDVNYYDPWSSNPRNVTIAPAMKDFSFAYQREIRTVVIPKEGNPLKEEFLFITIGNIEDIAKGFILENGQLKPMAR